MVGGKIREIICCFRTKATFGYKLQNEAVDELNQLIDDAELGKAMKWAYATRLYVPSMGYFRNQMIQFLLYQYNHRKDG